MRFAASSESTYAVVAASKESHSFIAAFTVASVTSNAGHCRLHGRIGHIQCGSLPPSRSHRSHPMRVIAAFTVASVTSNAGHCFAILVKPWNSAS